MFSEYDVRANMEEQLLETWRIHNRINLYLLAAIKLEALNDLSTSKGRTVAAQCAHIHNVRLMWLKSAAPELLAGVEKIEQENAVDEQLLKQAFNASGEAIAGLLQQSLAADGRVKGFKPHAVAFLGYLIAHEAHHRGQIALTLKQAGHALDKKTAYGLWEWGTR